MVADVNVFCALVIAKIRIRAPWLSELMVGISLSVNVRMSLNSCNLARASREESDNDIYSASMVDNATVVCLRDVHDIAPLFATKM